MKTKEITFTTIQRIKHNDFLYEKLNHIENILYDLYLHYDIDDFYQDEDNEDLNYLSMFLHKVELHQRELIKESKELVKSN
jgi:hypothetical protein